ncbi:MAG TPA: response regulator transcription factor [Bacillota bacterium]|nr:response regulator transcription factor [Bacillota bacterium]
MDSDQILIVDDELQMRSLIKLFLINHGFHVMEAKSGQECLDIINKNVINLVILDWMMPYMSGIEVCKQIRSGHTNPNLPILMLTAKDQKEDCVQGLWGGADDYMVKPFLPEELIARVSALLRRSNYSLPQRNNKILQSDELQINEQARTVLVNRSPLLLTPKEFDLLNYLAGHPDRVFSREYLLEKVWNYDYDGDVRTVDTHIKRIRSKIQKLGGKSDRIETIWGVGYKFTSEGSSL